MFTCPVGFADGDTIENTVNPFKFNSGAYTVGNTSGYTPSANGAFTLSAFIKVSNNNSECIFSKGNAMKLHIDGNVKFAMTSTSGSNPSIALSFTPALGQENMHVVVSCDGLNTSLFIDGIQKATSAAIPLSAWTASASDDFAIGEAIGGTDRSTGNISNVMFFNDGISASDLYENNYVKSFNDLNKLNQDLCRFSFPLSGSLADGVIDSTVNIHTLTQTGSATTLSTDTITVSNETNTPAPLASWTNRYNPSSTEMGEASRFGTTAPTDLEGISIPHNIHHEVTSHFTVEAVINTSNASLTQPILANYFQSSSSSGFSFNISNGSLSVIHAAANDTITTFDGDSNIISNNTTYHVAFTYDGSNVVIYVDGVASGTTAFTADFIKSKTPLSIGASYSDLGLFQVFEGTIMNVRVYRGVIPVAILSPMAIVNRITNLPSWVKDLCVLSVPLTNNDNPTHNEIALGQFTPTRVLTDGSRSDVYTGSATATIITEDGRPFTSITSTDRDTTHVEIGTSSMPISHKYITMRLRKTNDHGFKLSFNFTGGTIQLYSSGISDVYGAQAQSDGAFHKLSGAIEDGDWHTLEFDLEKLYRSAESSVQSTLVASIASHTTLHIRGSVDIQLIESHTKSRLVNPDNDNIILNMSSHGGHWLRDSGSVRDAVGSYINGRDCVRFPNIDPVFNSNAYKYQAPTALQKPITSNPWVSFEINKKRGAKVELEIGCQDSTDTYHNFRIMTASPDVTESHVNTTGVTTIILPDSFEATGWHKIEFNLNDLLQANEAVENYRTVERHNECWFRSAQELYTTPVTFKRIGSSTIDHATTRQVNKDLLVDAIGTNLISKGLGGATYTNNYYSIAVGKVGMNPDGTGGRKMYMAGSSASLSVKYSYDGVNFFNTGKTVTNAYRILYYPYDGGKFFVTNEGDAQGECAIFKGHNQWNTIDLGHTCRLVRYATFTGQTQPRLVAIPRGGGTYKYSDDHGATWSASTDTGSMYECSVGEDASGNVMMMSIERGSGVKTSIDGVNWTDRATFTGGNMLALEYVGGNWVALAHNAIHGISTDHGDSWGTIPSSVVPAANYYGSCKLGDYMYAANYSQGANTGIVRTLNGLDFEFLSAPTSKYLGVAGYENELVACSYSAGDRIFVSRPEELTRHTIGTGSNGDTPELITDPTAPSGEYWNISNGPVTGVSEFRIDLLRSVYDKKWMKFSFLGAVYSTDYVFVRVIMDNNVSHDVGISLLGSEVMDSAASHVGYDGAIDNQWNHVELNLEAAFNKNPNNVARSIKYIKEIELHLVGDYKISPITFSSEATKAITPIGDKDKWSESMLVFDADTFETNGTFSVGTSGGTVTKEVGTGENGADVVKLNSVADWEGFYFTPNVLTDSKYSTHTTMEIKLKRTGSRPIQVGRHSTGQRIYARETYVAETNEWSYAAFTKKFVLNEWVVLKIDLLGILRANRYEDKSSDAINNTIEQFKLFGDIDIEYVRFIEPEKTVTILDANDGVAVGPAQDAFADVVRYDGPSLVSTTLVQKQSNGSYLFKRGLGIGGSWDIEAMFKIVFEPIATQNNPWLNITLKSVGTSATEVNAFLRSRKGTDIRFVNIGSKSTKSHAAYDLVEQGTKLLSGQEVTWEVNILELGDHRTIDESELWFKGSSDIEVSNFSFHAESQQAHIAQDESDTSKIGEVWHSCHSTSGRVTTGDMRCISSGVINGQMYHVAGRGSQTYSTDGGYTWTNSISTQSIEAMKYMSKASATSTEAQGGKFIGVRSNSTVKDKTFMYSDDGGVSWLQGGTHATFTGTGKGLAYCEEGDHANHKHVILMTGTNDSSIRKSVDHGDTWTTIPSVFSGSTYCAASTIHKRDNGDIIAILVGQNSEISWSMAHTQIKAVSSGKNHTHYITASGDLYGMGSNYYGRLGDGTTTSRHSPVLIASNVASVACGREHTHYITTSGDLYGMGRNSFGRLGDGTTTSRQSPVLIASSVASVACGGNHAHYITTSGDLYGMGRNSYGQLGDGTTTDRQSPVLIASSVASVACGGNHAHYITTSGDLYGMGRNSSGRLGDGTTTDRHSPVLIASSVASVSCGGYHTHYITNSGELFGTGRNTNGQIGNNSSASVLTPVSIATNVKSVSNKGSSTHYITNDGKLFGMGSNTYGQIGNGQSGNDLWLPTPIRSLDQLGEENTWTRFSSSSVSVGNSAYDCAVFRDRLLISRSGSGLGQLSISLSDLIIGNDDVVTSYNVSDSVSLSGGFFTVESNDEAAFTARYLYGTYETFKSYDGINWYKYAQSTDNDATTATRVLGLYWDGTKLLAGGYASGQRRIMISDGSDWSIYNSATDATLKANPRYVVEDGRECSLLSDGKDPLFTDLGSVYSNYILSADAPSANSSTPWIKFDIKTTQDGTLVYASDESNSKHAGLSFGSTYAYWANGGNGGVDANVFRQLPPLRDFGWRTVEFNAVDLYRSHTANVDDTTYFPARLHCITTKAFIANIEFNAEPTLPYNILTDPIMDQSTLPTDVTDAGGVSKTFATSTTINLGAIAGRKILKVKGVFSSTSVLTIEADHRTYPKVETKFMTEGYLSNLPTLSHEVVPEGKLIEFEYDLSNSLTRGGIISPSDYVQAIKSITLEGGIKIYELSLHNKKTLDVKPDYTPAVLTDITDGFKFTGSSTLDSPKGDSREWVTLRAKFGKHSTISMKAKSTGFASEIDILLTRYTYDTPVATLCPKVKDVDGFQDIHFSVENLLQQHVGITGDDRLEYITEIEVSNDTEITSFDISDIEPAIVSSVTPYSLVEGLDKVYGDRAFSKIEDATVLWSVDKTTNPVIQTNVFNTDGALKIIPSNPYAEEFKKKTAMEIKFKPLTTIQHNTGNSFKIVVYAGTDVGEKSVTYYSRDLTLGTQSSTETHTLLTDTYATDTWHTIELDINAGIKSNTATDHTNIVLESINQIRVHGQMEIEYIRFKEPATDVVINSSVLISSTGSEVRPKFSHTPINARLTPWVRFKVQSSTSDTKAFIDFNIANGNDPHYDFNGGLGTGGTGWKAYQVSYSQPDGQHEYEMNVMNDMQEDASDRIISGFDFAFTLPVGGTAELTDVSYHAEPMTTTVVDADRASDASAFNINGAGTSVTLDSVHSDSPSGSAYILVGDATSATGFMVSSQHISIDADKRFMNITMSPQSEDWRMWATAITNSGATVSPMLWGGVSFAGSTATPSLNHDRNLEQGKWYNISLDLAEVLSERSDTGGFSLERLSQFGFRGSVNISKLTISATPEFNGVELADKTLTGADAINTIPITLRGQDAIKFTTPASGTWSVAIALTTLGVDALNVTIGNAATPSMLTNAVSILSDDNYGSELEFNLSDIVGFDGRKAMPAGVRSIATVTPTNVTDVSLFSAESDTTKTVHLAPTNTNGVGGAIVKDEAPFPAAVAAGSTLVRSVSPDWGTGQLKEVGGIGHATYNASHLLMTANTLLKYENTVGSTSNFATMIEFTMPASVPANGELLNFGGFSLRKQGSTTNMTVMVGAVPVDFNLPVANGVNKVAISVNSNRKMLIAVGGAVITHDLPADTLDISSNILLGGSGVKFTGGEVEDFRVYGHSLTMKEIKILTA